MKTSFRSLPLLFLFVTLFSCTSGERKIAHQPTLQDIEEWILPEYSLYSGHIRQEIADLMAVDTTSYMYADTYVRQYYAARRDFIWITRHGIDERADSLLSCLSHVEEEGFSPRAFHVEEIAQDLQTLRQRDLKDSDVNQLMGRLEYRLTQAFFRYAAGQRFGYIQPKKLFNHLLEEENDGEITYRHCFDLPVETARDTFYRAALRLVHEGRITDFLQQVQPQDSLYLQLRQDYQEARLQGNSKRSRLARINMERARWRYPRPTGKHVWVNLAGFELTAVDPENDSILRMRICGGNPTHKTPLLCSQIKHLELNPFWVIPQSIIKKELAPKHAQDSAYFHRNHYRIFSKETQEEMAPEGVTAAMLTSGQYTVKQDNGEGNSLGRMIFRFPNNFSVYLHDTNNRGAFERTFRAVSHGCIRLEKPLDLAFFLMNDEDAQDEEKKDKIRMAIDVEPVSDWGKELLESDPDFTRMRSYKFQPAIPVWLDYYTLYPNPEGVLETHPDSYQYDVEIEKLLDGF